MGKYDFELELFNDNPLARIAEMVKENSKVLEFGPANGRLTQYLKEQKKCCVDIVEIDYESGVEASEYAQKSYLGAEKGDIEKYYWLDTDERYDYIIFADVLEHLINPWDVLKKCKKIMQPSARILVSIPNVAHNSIIIGLMKGEFQYNPTGLLDNTHVRFFTRNSFAKMAQEQGLAIVDEKSINIRVGETEIATKYSDLPKEVYKELMNIPNGDVYQYVFALALNEEYLSGNCERIVSLDSTSYYYAEMQYEVGGMIDYRNSVQCYLNPRIKVLSLEFPVLKNATKAVCNLLNTNAVLAIREMRAEDSSGNKRVIEFSHNGKQIGDKCFFLYENPQIKISLPETCAHISVIVQVYNYDFDVDYYKEIIELLDETQKKLEQTMEIYEKEIQKKDEEFKNCVATYEKEIQRREEERKKLLEMCGPKKWFK